MTGEAFPWAEDVVARLARVEAMLQRLTPEDERPDAAALRLLSEATGGDWTTSGEMWRLVREKATRAALDAMPEPPLSVALRSAGITNPHALGRWLARQPSVERVTQSRLGVLWRIRGFDPANPCETA